MYAAKKTTAVPRSVESTRIPTWAAATIVVITTDLNDVSRASFAAIKKTSVIFTSSENWIVMPWNERDSFAPPEVAEADREAEQKERRVQEAMLRIKNRYGKNAIIKGMNLQQGATAMERSRQIGGHQAELKDDEKNE